MKKSFHPQIFKDATIKCVSCSTVYKIPTTVKELQVEVCAGCHPIYTGEDRGIMKSGRVDRFRSMQEASKKLQESKKK